MKLNRNTTERIAYCDLLRRNGPYAYFITLTFPRLQTLETCCQQINFLLHLLNRKIFGRNNIDYINGFCIFECHGMSANNSLHSHILIKYDPNFDLESKPTFVDHFWNLIGKVNVVKTARVTDKLAFNKKCCKIKPVYYEEGLIWYVTKSFEWRFDYNYFRPISKDGI